jgi:hypothetical protein
MRTRCMVTLGLAVILGTSACSSSSEEKPKSQTNAVTNSANSNTVAVRSGAEVAPPQPLDANSANAASTDPISQPGADKGKFDKLRTDGAVGPPMDAATIAAKNARPAPDNSTFSSYLTDAAYEIRTFKDHPQLLKVEKKVTSDGQQTLKVFLRGGKVIDLPGQSLDPLAKASAAHILNIAGVASQPQRQQAPAGPAPTKKSGE